MRHEKGKFVTRNRPTHCHWLRASCPLRHQLHVLMFTQEYLGLLLCENVQIIHKGIAGLCRVWTLTRHFNCFGIAKGDFWILASICSSQTCIMGYWMLWQEILFRIAMGSNITLDRLFLMHRVFVTGSTS